MAAREKCPVCCSADIRVQTPSPYHYEHAGLSNVVLVGGVTVTECASCGSVVTRVEKEPQLLEVLGLMVLGRPGALKGEELRYLRALFGMTQAEMASALGISRRATIAGYEAQARVFKGKMDEIGLRVLLIGLFRKQIIEAEFSSLSDLHRKQFRSLENSFTAKAHALVDEKRKHFSVKMQSPAKGWATEPLAGAC